MQRYPLAPGAASALYLAVFSPALATPVTSADLSGKKICWDNGSASNYGHGGKYSNNVSGHGTWSLTSSGVRVHTDRYDYVASIQKMPDGTFHAVVLGAGMKSSGKYCN
jgi:hypothetical protein